MGDDTIDPLDAFNAWVGDEQKALAERIARQRGEQQVARLRLAETLAAECNTDPVTAYNTLLDCKWSAGKARKRLTGVLG